MTASTIPAALPMAARLLYSVSSLGGEALGRSRGTWLLFFYAPAPESGLPQLLPLGLVGTLLTVLGLVGALDDTLLGYWSDRTRSRLGRRLPFILVGTPLVGIYIFPYALTADIVDHDAVQTGMRREAIYFGMQGFVERTSTAAAPAILAGLISLGATTANPIGVRLVGPVAGLFMLASVVLFRFYTLPDQIIPDTPNNDPGRVAPARDRAPVATVAAGHQSGS